MSELRPLGAATGEKGGDWPSVVRSEDYREVKPGRLWGT